VGARYSAHVQTGPGPNQPPIQWVSVFYPGVKQFGRGVDHTPTSITEVKERVNIYLNPFPNFVACSRVTFTFKTG